VGLDTRRVCRLSNEQATDQMLRQLDPRLRFRRIYNKSRPFAAYWEDSIELA
jgi:tRNA(adenine34) deaminase